MVAGCRSSWQRGAGWRRSRQGDSGRAGEGKQGPRARSYLSWAGRKISGGGGGERIDGRGRQRAGVRPSSETTSSAVSPARRPRLAAAGIGGADTFRHLPPPHPPPPAALGHSPPIADSSPPPASFRASSVPASACRSSFSPPSLLRFFLAIVPPSVTRPILHPALPATARARRPTPDTRCPPRPLSCLSGQCGAGTASVGGNPPSEMDMTHERTTLAPISPSSTYLQIPPPTAITGLPSLPPHGARTWRPSVPLSAAPVARWRSPHGPRHPDARCGRCACVGRPRARQMPLSHHSSAQTLCQRPHAPFLRRRGPRQRQRQRQRTHLAAGVTISSGLARPISPGDDSPLRPVCNSSNADHFSPSPGCSRVSHFIPRPSMTRPLLPSAPPPLGNLASPAN